MHTHTHTHTLIDTRSYMQLLDDPPHELSKHTINRRCSLLASSTDRPTRLPASSFPLTPELLAASAGGRLLDGSSAATITNSFAFAPFGSVFMSALSRDAQWLRLTGQWFRPRKPTAE